MIVVDASTLLETLLPNRQANPTLLRLSSGDELHAPHLVDVEFAQVLRRFHRSGLVSGEDAAKALRNLADLPLERHAHIDRLERIWALRGNLTAYDAVYVALAEALDAPLLTRDARLANAPGVRARIELIQ